MDIAKSEGKYTTEQMQKAATLTSTVDGLEISGNNFKVNTLMGCPDMVLFACEKNQLLEQEILSLQLTLSLIKDSLSEVSCFVENLDDTLVVGKAKALNTCLEIGGEIRNLDLPEIS